MCSATYQTNVLIDRLYAPVGFWYEKLGMDEFLDRQYNSILHAESDGSSIQCNTSMNALPSRHRYHVPRVLDRLVRVLHLRNNVRSLEDVPLRVPDPHLEYTAIGRVGTGRQVISCSNRGHHEKTAVGTLSKME